MIKYLRNLCLLTGVDNGEVDGGVDGVHGEDNDHLCSILVTCGKSSICS